jgi:uncharacterized protein (TIGR04255 family)
MKGATHMTTPFQVDDPADEVLLASPLKLVVCQVRHDPQDAASLPATTLQIQELLAPWDLRIRPLRIADVQFALGPNGISVGQQENAKAWQLHTPDDKWTVSITPEWFSIETLAYQRWSDFSQRCSQVVAAVKAVLAPVIETRIGLRYVDEVRVRSVSSANDWVGKIATPLVGMLANPTLGPAVETSQQLVQLDAGENLGVALRHGSLVDERGPFYLLDHDCSHVASRAFDASAIEETLEELHRIARHVFRSGLEPDFYEQLRSGQVA